MLPDPKREATRLLNDSEHLKRKAAYFLELAERGGSLAEGRRTRAAELLAKANESG